MSRFLLLLLLLLFGPLFRLLFRGLSAAAMVQQVAVAG
jgi:hypothetical protein